MKAMTLRLDETEYERLRTLAFVEKRSVTDVVREALEGYVRAKAEQAEFRAALQRALQENAPLIADLARY
jgi:predicted transcriptional regulator